MKIVMRKGERVAGYVRSAWKCLREGLDRRELLLVSLTIGMSYFFSRGGFSDLLAAGAVFFGYLHASAAFDLEESRVVDGGQRVVTTVYLGKELLWFATYVLLGSIPLMVGSILFLSIPWIRAKLRRSKLSDPQSRRFRKRIGGRRPPSRCRAINSRPLRGRASTPLLRHTAL
jgi:hypothetical protein